MSRLFYTTCTNRISSTKIRYDIVINNPNLEMQKVKAIALIEFK